MSVMGDEDAECSGTSHSSDSCKWTTYQHILFRLCCVYASVNFGNHTTLQLLSCRI